jgi:hypothetical protein
MDVDSLLPRPSAQLRPRLVSCLGPCPLFSVVSFAPAARSGLVVGAWVIDQQFPKSNLLSGSRRGWPEQITGGHICPFRVALFSLFFLVCHLISSYLNTVS